MKLWIGWLGLIIGLIFEIGREQQKADDNKTGIDDLIGGILIGIGFILQAVMDYFNDGAENKTNKVFALKTG